MRCFSARWQGRLRSERGSGGDTPEVAGVFTITYY